MSTVEFPEEDDNNNLNKKNSDINKFLKKLSEIPVNEISEDDTINKDVSEKLFYIIQEYLSPYIIIGYDIKGKNVVLSNIKNQKDHDAINLALKRFYYTAQRNMGMDFDFDDDDDDISGIFN